ncbi:MAG: photosystem II cytochrome c-550, partial [Microcoleaceae cyanobacterium]
FIALATVFLTFQMFIGSAWAVELSEKVRTVPLNDKGEQVVISLKQLKEGQRIFIDTCSQCHARGMTKTDPNVNLSPETLALATPSRDNIESLVDYMKNPTSYDGLDDISELHPSTKSADIFGEMRNLSDDDLFNIAGYILIEPKVLGAQWAGGKANR